MLWMRFPVLPQGHNVKMTYRQVPNVFGVLDTHSCDEGIWSFLGVPTPGACIKAARPPAQCRIPHFRGLAKWFRRSLQCLPRRVHLADQWLLHVQCSFLHSNPICVAETPSLSVPLVAQTPIKTWLLISAEMRCMKVYQKERGGERERCLKRTETVLSMGTYWHTGQVCVGHLFQIQMCQTFHASLNTYTLTPNQMVSTYKRSTFPLLQAETFYFFWNTILH